MLNEYLNVNYNYLRHVLVISVQGNESNFLKKLNNLSVGFIYKVFESSLNVLFICPVLA